MIVGAVVSNLSGSIPSIVSIQVTSVKCRFDQWESSSPTDAHVPAALLKQWLRELYIPLIPDAASYNDAIAVGEDVELAVSLVMKLPELHRVILTYLIRSAHSVLARKRCIQYFIHESRQQQLSMLDN